MKRSYKIGIVVIGLLALMVAVARIDISTENMPLPGNIQEAEAEFKSLERELAIRKKKMTEYNKKKARLREQAEQFWPAAQQKPKVAVQSAFEKLARKAHVTVDSMGGLRMSEASDNIRTVEFSVQLRTSMQEFSKLLAELEKSSYPFYWDRCRIRPDNRRNPRNVRITGKLKAYVLTPEATEFIYGKRQEDTS